MGSYGARITRIFLLLFAIYGIAIGAYLWLDAGQPLPEAYRGTPVDPATFLTESELEGMKQLSVLRNLLYFISYPWEWGVYLLLLFSGAASRWSKRYRLPVYILAICLAVFALQLPLRIAGFTLSRSYGISVQSVASWLKDAAIGFGIDYVLMLAVAWAVYYIMARVRRWWLVLWMLSVPFIIFMFYIQPVLIDPLYNKFEPLSDPVLEDHILELADKAGVPADRVYEVNISEKTKSLNAYVNGIGSTLRIVLWDTTLKAMDEKQILFIMAHEIGHYVMRHLEWSVLGSIGSSFVLLWAGSRIYRISIAKWGMLAGIWKEQDRSGLPLMLLILSVLAFLAAPVSNAVSRESERAADRYAIQLMGDSEGTAISMYQKLASSSLSDIDPPKLVEWFRSTHPSITERIQTIQAEEAKQ